VAPSIDRSLVRADARNQVASAAFPRDTAALIVWHAITAKRREPAVCGTAAGRLQGRRGWPL